ncbi:MAG: polysaccharide deacetylase family protein [Alphaproteobacteria bacterium]
MKKPKVNKADLLKAGLKALHYSGVDRLMARNWQGVGMIYMLHMVNREPTPAFSPNRILSITPEFLEAVIVQVLQAGLDVVNPDEMFARLTSDEPSRRFVCFTFDDCYRDNLEIALPLFRKYNLPMTIYVPSDYPDGSGELWWLALEKVIAENERISVKLDGVSTEFPCATVDQKWSAFNTIYAYWQGQRIDEDNLRHQVRNLCERHAVDMCALTRGLIMDWNEVRSIAEDPLVTIGAHTKSHYALAKLDEARAQAEIAEGLDRLQEAVGCQIEHFAYPYGGVDSAGPRDFDLVASHGFKTAVTTRKGMLFPEHASHLMALPRVSLNGDYQSLIYNSTYMTGAPFALLNRFRRTNVG